MKAREDVVGMAVEQLAVPVEDIEDAVMRAARQQPVFIVLRNNKALLVAEIVADLFAVFQAGQLSVSLRLATPARDVAEQKQLVVYFQIAVRQPNVRQTQNSRIDTDIALAIIMRLCG